MAINGHDIPTDPMIPAPPARIELFRQENRLAEGAYGFESQRRFTRLFGKNENTVSD
ncbi:hypothetical protein [Slackia heliotrinireducens]|uniref:hypothetical protein n=1 Tax=Slackia heliotrinireducens TaxID=84110 RepID=UPI00145C9BBF|nr:hypothetical protein [Slackia heliotrinireducens]